MGAIQKKALIPMIPTKSQNKMSLKFQWWIL